jgi:hypothetical protein
MAYSVDTSIILDDGFVGYLMTLSQLCHMLSTGR